MTKNNIIILLGLLLIIGSNIIGHYKPPFSIMITPLLMLFIVGFINYRLYKNSFIPAVFYSYGLILFNDLFIRLYAGGIHDQPGKGFIFLFSSIAFLLSSLCMLIYAFRFIPIGNLTENRRVILKNVLTVVVIASLTAFVYNGYIGDI